MSGLLDTLLGEIAVPVVGEELFDHLSDIVYFIKDRHAAYVLVNRTLVERCGARDKLDLIGKTTVEVLGETLGRCFEIQDREVIATGKPILAQLELHLHRSGNMGWCLTTKLPLRDRQGNIIGLIGASQDLKLPDLESDEYAELSRTIQSIEADLRSPVSVARMAEMARMSRYQLDRRMKVVFGLSAGQWLLKVRVHVAQQLLQQTDLPISQIAMRVGYSDQSAFSRQFRLSTGFTPHQFRITR